MKIIAILALTLILGCKMPPMPKAPYHKWRVKMCNSIGCDEFECDAYTHSEPNTYILLDSAGNITNQLTISAGITVEIQRNKP